MKLIVLAATASVSSALGPLAPSVSARDMMPKKLGARWYTGYQTAYPNGAKDMPDAPPESTSATLGDHDPKLFNFWKQIHDHEDQYEVAPARPVRTELTADQTLELLSTLAGVERPSSIRERRRPATASPDIAELHSRRLNIEQRIVDATRQVRELQELGRVIAT